MPVHRIVWFSSLNETNSGSPSKGTTAKLSQTVWLTLSELGKWEETFSVISLFCSICHLHCLGFAEIKQWRFSSILPIFKVTMFSKLWSPILSRYLTDPVHTSLQTTVSSFILVSHLWGKSVASFKPHVPLKSHHGPVCFHSLCILHRPDYLRSPLSPKPLNHIFMDSFHWNSSPSDTKCRNWGSGGLGRVSLYGHA